MNLIEPNRIRLSPFDIVIVFLFGDDDEDIDDGDSRGTRTVLMTTR